MLILSGDHIYKMDYGRMLAQHAQSGADMTVACMDVPIEEASAFGVMGVNETSRVTSFVEKPKDPPAIPGQPDRALASMGIYVFNAAVPLRTTDPRRRRPAIRRTTSART